MDGDIIIFLTDWVNFTLTNYYCRATCAFSVAVVGNITTDDPTISTCGTNFSIDITSFIVGKKFAWHTIKQQWLANEVTVHVCCAIWFEYFNSMMYNKINVPILLCWFSGLWTLWLREFTCKPQGQQTPTPRAPHEYVFDVGCSSSCRSWPRGGN